MSFTIITTQHQGLSIDQAEHLSTLMSRVEDENAPSDIRHSSYFLLIKIKSEMLEEELYEQMKDFKFLEDLHQITIPVDQMPLLK